MQFHDLVAIMQCRSITHTYIYLCICIYIYRHMYTLHMNYIELYLYPVCIWYKMMLPSKSQSVGLQLHRSGVFFFRSPLEWLWLEWEPPWRQLRRVLISTCFRNFGNSKNGWVPLGWWGWVDLRLFWVEVILKYLLRLIHFDYVDGGWVPRFLLGHPQVLPLPLPPWCQVVQQSIFQKVKDYWGEDDDEAMGFCLLNPKDPGSKCVCCLEMGGENMTVRWFGFDVQAFKRLTCIYLGVDVGCTLMYWYMIHIYI